MTCSFCCYLATFNQPAFCAFSRVHPHRAARGRGVPRSLGGSETTRLLRGSRRSKPRGKLRGQEQSARAYPTDAGIAAERRPRSSAAAAARGVANLASCAAAQLRSQNLGHRRANAGGPNEGPRPARAARGCRADDQQRSIGAGARDPLGQPPQPHRSAVLAERLGGRVPAGGVGPGGQVIEQVTAEPPSSAADRNRAAPRERERGPRPPPGRDRSGGGYWEAADYKGVTSTARR